MCFQVDPKHLAAKIAEEDIVCYKVFQDTCLEKHFISISKSHCYDKGARFDNNVKLKPCAGIIEEGIHSYVKPPVQNPEYPKGNFNGWICAIQVKCIIPKGTVYFLNETYDAATVTPNLATYVSESIIIGTDEDMTLKPQKK